MVKVKDLKHAFKKNLTYILLLIICTLLYIILPYTNINTNYIDIVKKPLVILIYFTIGWILTRLSNFYFKNTINRKYQISKEDNLHERMMQTKLRYLHSTLKVVIWLVVAGLIFSLFDNLKTIGSSILVSAGITSVIIGFAAQKSIANLIAGFQIAFTQPIRIDDAVVVEGEWGWIEEITLTYVIVKIWDKRRLVLPISYFVEKPFQNWTKNSSDILGSVFLYTDYRVPVDTLRKELTKILSKTDLWDKEVGIIQVTNTTPTGIELRVLVSAKTSPKAWDLRCLVREKLIYFIQKKYPESLPVTRAEIKKVLL